MCKLLRLVAGRSVLLWVGCGCGEEIFAILRRVRHLYVVALEQNKDDLATFRTTLEGSSRRRVWFQSRT
jgi:hypothetical protein